MPGTSAAERWRSLTREQKLSVGVLGVCGVIALVFSIVRIRTAITRPFTTPVGKLLEVKKLLGPTDAELLETQKKTDTDGDGLSDYDESYTYKTSPYLKDSDSDGDQDNIEIAMRTDPNCPKGKTCVEGGGGTEAPGPLKPSLDLTGTGASTGIAGTAIPPREPNAVRVWLKTLGFSDSDLASYTDAQILEAYDEATKAETVQASATSSGQ